MDNGRNAWPVILDGVTDEILENLLQLSLMNADRRQQFGVNRRPRLRNCACEIANRGPHGDVRVHVRWVSINRGDLGICKEVPHKHLHAAGTVAYVAEEFQRLIVQFVAITVR
jgi:hypothetical protein